MKLLLAISCLVASWSAAFVLPFTNRPDEGAMIAIIAPWADMDRLLTELVESDFYVLGRHAPRILSVYRAESSGRNSRLLSAGLLLLIADQSLPICTSVPFPQTREDQA